MTITSSTDTRIAKIQHIEGKQEVIAAVKELVNEKTACHSDFDRDETETDATAAPPQGMITDSDNSQWSMAVCMACKKEQTLTSPVLATKLRSTPVMIEAGINLENEVNIKPVHSFV